MIVHGSDINLTALSEVKSLADLKKLNIFSHLTNKDEANENLWRILKPKPTDKVPEGNNEAG